MLLALLLTVGWIPVGRAAGTELRLSVPEELPGTGEPFTVTVDISGNPGFAAAQFTLAYDPGTVKCESAVPGTLLDGALSAANEAAPGGAIVAAAAAEEVRGDGQLAVFTFTVRREVVPSAFRLRDIVLSRGDGAAVEYTVVRTSKNDSAFPGTQEGPAEETSAGPGEPGGTQTPADRPQEASFTDVTGHWAEAEILRAAELGIVGGYEDGTFRPDAGLTRAQFAAILWRRAGRPAAEKAAPFTDLEGLSGEFQAAVAWAYEKGLAGGTGPGVFTPHGTLSRQAAMKLLFQYGGGTAGVEQMFYGVYDGAFSDSGQLAEWARAPVYWGIYNTLIEAGDGNVLHPAEPMTRAQLARSMIRYIEKFGEEEKR